MVAGLKLAAYIDETSETSLWLKKIL